MNGAVIAFSLAGCAGYFYLMSALGKWLARSAEFAAGTPVPHAPGYPVVHSMSGQPEQIAS